MTQESNQLFQSTLVTIGHLKEVVKRKKKENIFSNMNANDLRLFGKWIFLPMKKTGKLNVSRYNFGKSEPKWTNNLNTFTLIV